MPLLLKAVAPGRGLAWLRDAMRLYARRPLAFTLLFAAFLFASLVVSVVPYLGFALQLMSLPLLSLGFMIASQSALLDGPVRPAQFIEPLRGDPARRRSLLLLCLLYGAAALAILWLCNAVSDGALARLFTAGGSLTPAELDALRAQRGLAAAVLLLMVLGTLLSVAFWHAPALVHWGAQGVAQSLFSSTLALWRSRGAFVVYSVAFAGVVVVFSTVIGVLAALLGASQAVLLLALPAGLFFSTIFYVSLLFTFNDSFGGTEG